MASCWDHHGDETKTLTAFATHRKCKTKIQVSVFPSCSSIEHGLQGPACPRNTPCPVPTLFPMSHPPPPHPNKWGPTPAVPPSQPRPRCFCRCRSSRCWLSRKESFLQDILSCPLRPPAPPQSPHPVQSRHGVPGPSGRWGTTLWVPGAHSAPGGGNTRGEDGTGEAKTPPPVTPSPPAAPHTLPPPPHPPTARLCPLPMPKRPALSWASPPPAPPAQGTGAAPRGFAPLLLGGAAPRIPPSLIPKAPAHLAAGDAAPGDAGGGAARGAPTARTTPGPTSTVSGRVPTRATTPGRGCSPRSVGSGPQCGTAVGGGHTTTTHPERPQLPHHLRVPLLRRQTFPGGRFPPEQPQRQINRVRHEPSGCLGSWGGASACVPFASPPGQSSPRWPEPGC